jgi:hypothetical protein
LENPPTIKERRQNREIAVPLLVFIVIGSMVEKRLIKGGINVAGEWYLVELFTNAGPDSRCEFFCRQGHIDNICGNKPKCGYCSGNHRTSDHKCNEVGCTANRDHSAATHSSSTPIAKEITVQAADGAQGRAKPPERRGRAKKTGTEWQDATSKATHTATGTNQAVLGHRPIGRGSEDGRTEEEETADPEEEEEMGDACDVTMTEAEFATTTMPETETDSEAAAWATNNYTDTCYGGA